MGETHHNAVVADFNDGEKRTLARGQNFLVERIAAAQGDSLTFDSAHETILLMIEAAAIAGTGDTAVGIGSRSIAILPPGSHDLSFVTAGRLFLLATQRNDISIDGAVNAAQYASRNERVAAIGEPFRNTASSPAVVVRRIDDVPTPVGNNRIKFVQSATMSINWVEYDGPRDRTILSPHSHTDFEQGSLALEGDYVHHVRTEWTANANLWREDGHLAAASDTLLIVPPEIIHTTEGVGDGHHILVDVFAPPRRDFIAKGLVHNAADYADPVIEKVLS